jgi:excisionase family DNA binding protein
MANIPKDGSSEMLDRSEAAKRIGVSVGTIHNYVQRGILPAYELPTGARRFRVEDVDALLTPVKTSA